MPLSEKEVLGALAALEESACLLRGQWYAERHFRHKGRIDLVTTMDVKIQQTLGAALGRVTPGVPLVAEEGNDGAPVFPERCWIVDPIDGTTNFVHGIPLVGITAAFWEHDGPVFGMTACPMLKEGQVFYADYAKPEGFCDEAWKAIYQYVFALAHGAGNQVFYYGDWIKTPGVAICSCNDGLRPVIFKLETTTEESEINYEPVE